MTTYWNELEIYNQSEHKRALEFIKKQHEYKMKELEKEIELHKLQMEEEDDKCDCNSMG